MEIIVFITPKCESFLKVNVMVAVIRINIECFQIPPEIDCFICRPLVRVGEEDPTSQLNVLWKTSLLVHYTRPAWYDAAVASWSTPMNSFSNILTND